MLRRDWWLTEAGGPALQCLYWQSQGSFTRLKISEWYESYFNLINSDLQAFNLRCVGKTFPKCFLSWEVVGLFKCSLQKDTDRGTHIWAWNSMSLYSINLESFKKKRVLFLKYKLSCSKQLSSPTGKLHGPRESLYPRLLLPCFQIRHKDSLLVQAFKFHHHGSF